MVWSGQLKYIVLGGNVYVTIEEDENGDLILPVSDKICAELGWKIGDTLRWTSNQDGSFTISKVVTE